MQKASRVKETRCKCESLKGFWGKGFWCFLKKNLVLNVSGAKDFTIAAFSQKFVHKMCFLEMATTRSALFKAERRPSFLCLVGLYFWETSARLTSKQKTFLRFYILILASVLSSKPFVPSSRHNQTKLTCYLCWISANFNQPWQESAASTSCEDCKLPTFWFGVGS